MSDTGWEHLHDTARLLDTIDLGCVDRQHAQLFFASSDEETSNSLLVAAAQNNWIGFIRVLLGMGMNVDAGILHPPLVGPCLWSNRQMV